MEKIKNSALVFLSIFVLTACSSTYWASVKNSTDEHLLLKAVFKSEYGTQVMEMPLKSGEVNVWQYQQPSNEEKKMDKNLTSLEIISKSGCHIVFTKEEIRKKVEDTIRQIEILSNDLNRACVD